MANALATTDITALLDRAEGSLIADLLSQANEADAIEKRGNNAAIRKAATRKALAENNKIVQTRVSESGDVALARGQRLAAASDSIMEIGLDSEQVEQAMEAHLSSKLVTESLGAIQDLVRSLVFRSMDLAAAEQGEEFPEHTNMVMDVPSLGKRFAREGAGRKPAEVDLAALRESLGDEVFFAVTAEKVVVTRVVDTEALSAAVVSDPSLLEKVRSAVVPGDWKSPRLMIRDIPANEKE